MKPPGRRFWGWAVGAAAAVAIAAALFLPYETLGLRTVAERERAWLLTVWTAGVMAVLFGAAARLARPVIGIRDVLDAGSLRAALEVRRRAGRSEAGAGFDLWLVVTGMILIAIYFGGWLLL